MDARNSSATLSQAKLANELVKGQKAKAALEKLQAAHVEHENALALLRRLIQHSRETWPIWPLAESVGALAKDLEVDPQGFKKTLKASIGEHLAELAPLPDTL